MKVYLGIDTSCYTTSAALLDENGHLVADERKILDVKQGGCGLQQHEMLFQHTRVLPVLLDKAFQNKDFQLASIGVSGRPRPASDSYMPAFLAGLGVARSLATVWKVPIVIESHQENHLLAGLWSCGGIQAKKFLMLHASGGTTDLLLVEKMDNGHYGLQAVGGSIDLHAGQFVDRVGVALGLQFPTGKEFEKLAATAKEKILLPISVNKTEVSLSGPATAALRKLQSGAEPADLALAVEICLAETFIKMMVNAASMYKVKDVLMVGGVASNLHIQKLCDEKLYQNDIKLYCAATKYSCDCAVGNAYAALQMAKKGCSNIIC
ncbi:MAG: O-sialoglycoprotein endopeptidase [Phascolarctobacterium sp.]|nr:O-sialoglycoprotein endopeptidase [Candidatus Phascolarctobacterium caballi]